MGSLTRPEIRAERLRHYKKLAGYRRRRCYSSHACCLCPEEITIGQEYFDGGYGRRAHVVCIDRAARQLCGKGTGGGGRVCFLPDKHEGLCMFQCGRPNLDDYFPED